MIKKITLYFCWLLVIVVMLFITSCGQAYSEPTQLIPTIVFTPSPMPTPTPTASETPTFPETPMPTPIPIIFPVEYTVMKGDTLGKISQFYGVPVAYIAVKNGISNVDLIFPGQVLIIPDPQKPPEVEVDSGKQIVVILSLQKTYAYENGELIKEFLVSTGLPNTPTVEGKFKIYLKYESTSMTGPGYSLQEVPFTMYFFEGYGLHGTYWHSNFGSPMSHGCVNMYTPDAEWLYEWAPLGTSVLVLP